MKHIWCILSRDNDYDQPDHNLVVWWPERPDIAVMAMAMGRAFPAADDEETLALAKLWSGDKIRLDNTDYILRALDPETPVASQ